MTIQALSPAIASYLHGHIEELNETACALFVIADKAAEQLDGEESISASALRAISREMNTQLGALLDDFNKMRADPKWNGANL